MEVDSDNILEVASLTDDMDEESSFTGAEEELSTVSTDSSNIEERNEEAVQGEGFIAPTETSPADFPVSTVDSEMVLETPDEELPPVPEVSSVVEEYLPNSVSGPDIADIVREAVQEAVAATLPESTSDDESEDDSEDTAPPVEVISVDALMERLTSVASESNTDIGQESEGTVNDGEVEPEEDIVAEDGLETGEEVSELVLSYEDMVLLYLSSIQADSAFHPMLTTPFEEYSVLEGLLLLLVLWLAVINPCIRMLKRGFSWLLS